MTREEIEAAIAQIEMQLNYGISRSDISGVGSTEWDIAALRKRRGELQVALAGMNPDRPIVRSIRTYSDKGL
jgi:hypothetical protein